MAEAAAAEEDGNASPVANNGQNRRHGFRTGAFAARGLSVHHKKANVTSFFYCSKHLLSHKGGIITVEFSDDGTLLALGGRDSIVRL